MTAMPKEATRMVKELERDVQAEEQVLRDLERDIRRDAEILQHLERDVAELERLLPEAVTREPTHRPRRAGRVAIAIGSGAVILAAGFGIGFAAQEQTVTDLEADVAVATQELAIATEELAVSDAMFEYAAYSMPFQAAQAAAATDSSLRHVVMGQTAGVGSAMVSGIAADTLIAEAAADLAQRVEHAQTAG